MMLPKLITATLWSLLAASIIGGIIPQVRAVNHESRNNLGVNIVSADNIIGGFFTNPAPNSKVSREIEYGHDGLDLWGTSGSPILAAASGEVVYVQNVLTQSGGYGYYILLKHTMPNTTAYTLYAHLAEPSGLLIGEEVTQGQAIGLMGNTGNSSGTHLHFSIFDSVNIEDGKLVNHPTCLSIYGSYSSNCYSPLQAPISIITYLPARHTSRLNSNKTAANPAYTSDYLINLQTVETQKGLSYDELNQTMSDVFGTSPISEPNNKRSTDSTLHLKETNSLVTKDKFADIVMKELRQSASSKKVIPSTVVFDDIEDLDKSNKYYVSIQRLVAMEILSLEDNKIHPSTTISRSEAAEAILKAAELVYSK